ncbi:MAG: hypothetical protein NT169_25905 [Chloroflexi bacterium]|nr:hypothetical protein [Chloroflexota bacterium]
MLPTLLWRCPICKTHDALTHEPRRFRPDLIRCRACQARWELKRVVGGPDFRLRLLDDKGPGEERGGVPPPFLAEWYDRMMAGLALTPIAHPAWPVAGVSAPNEELYLHSPQVRVLADAENPIFTTANAAPAPPSLGPLGTRPLGAGQLLFTSQRLLCLLAPPPAAGMGASPAAPAAPAEAAPTPPGAAQAPRALSLPWGELTSADTLTDAAFVTIFGERLYGFLLKEQSPLKWLAYARLMAERLDPAVQRRLHLGYV